MTLDELIGSIQGPLKVLERTGDQRVMITSLTDDSRKVESGSLFVAVKGERVDGHAFLDRVVAAGAAAVVVERNAPVGSIASVRVQDSRGALGILGSRFYRDPSAALRMIGGDRDERKNDDDVHCEDHARSGEPAGWPHRHGGLPYREGIHSGFPHHSWRTGAATVVRAHG